MTKFKEFLLEKKKKEKIRKDRFVWDTSDIVVHSGIREEYNEFGIHTDPYGSFHHPRVEHVKHFRYYKNGEYHDSDVEKHLESPEHTESLKSFIDAGNTLNDDNKAHIADYKESSSRVNFYLRNGERQEKKDPQVEDKIEGLDKITNMHTKHPITVYRGGTNFVLSHGNNFPPGSEFTDHGYVSTSFNPDQARKFGDMTATKGKGILGEVKHTKPIFKIHVPAGSKAHHFDSEAHNDHEFRHENEVVLHRGTRFRVSHHSRDNQGFHYIHVHVIGNENND